LGGAQLQPAGIPPEFSMIVTIFWEETGRLSSFEASEEMIAIFLKNCGRMPAGDFWTIPT
jgi:hypothetical protein